jgi:Na+-transporting NADH:ubiquinone oxidoreductase subunit NqrD
VEENIVNAIKIKSIKYFGKSDVYNMEVKEHHNFSVNGGLIVHNCIDMCRYACESDMKQQKLKTMNKSILGL